MELVELPVSGLPAKLNLPYNSSTYFRLLRNRSIKISSSNGIGMLPVFYLLPTRDQVLRYQWVPKINSILDEEFGSKHSYSDAYISERVGGVSRRAIATYRDLASVPPHGARKKAYNSGLKEPYKIATPIEAYIRHGNDEDSLQVNDSGIDSLNAGKKLMEGHQFQSSEDGQQDHRNVGVERCLVPLQQSEENIRWVCSKGAPFWRKLYYWAKEWRQFEEPDVRLLYWVSQRIERKKTPSASDARKARRLYETAVKKGWSFGSS